MSVYRKIAELGRKFDAAYPEGLSARLNWWSNTLGIDRRQTPSHDRLVGATGGPAQARRICRGFSKTRSGKTTRGCLKRGFIDSSHSSTTTGNCAGRAAPDARQWHREGSACSRYPSGSSQSFRTRHPERRSQRPPDRRCSSIPLITLGLPYQTPSRCRSCQLLILSLWWLPHAPDSSCPARPRSKPYNLRVWYQIEVKFA